MDFPPITAYLDTPFADLVAVLEQAVSGERSRAQLEAAGGLILHRTLALLRGASRDEILEEGLALGRFLRSDGGQAAASSHPDLYWGWIGLSGLLAEAARRSDRAALDSILRSQGGHGRRVLELLAERGGPMPRSEVRERLDLSESHLSHVLRDLSEADLILRTQVGREVAIDLGAIGHEVVARSLLPGWIRHLAETLKQARSAGGALPDLGTLTKDLVARGAPSALAARRLAEALAGPSAGITPQAERNAQDLIGRGDAQLQPTVSPKVLLFHRGAAA